MAVTLIPSDKNRYSEWATTSRKPLINTIEEQGSQDLSLRNSRENFRMRGKNTRNMDLRFLVGQGTTNPVYIVTRNPKRTKQRMWDKVEFIA
jgi:hypothetical protein